jgi:hypothetical protein
MQTEAEAARRRSPILGLVALGCAAAILVGYCGNYHFVYGSKVPFQKVTKVSWSLSEVLVNFDEVGGLPLIVARARYPLLLQALEREGLYRP